MDRRQYRREAWLLTFLYPLAAVLVLVKLRGGLMFPHFGRDWPYIIAGPFGVLLWWLVFDWLRTWPGWFAGYLAGAALCAAVVWGIEFIAERVFRGD